MAQKNNRRAKIVGTDIEVDITEKKDVIIESHNEDHEHDHHHKETFITKYIFSIDQDDFKTIPNYRIDNGYSRYCNVPTF